MRGPQHVAYGHTRQDDVVDITPPAPKQPRILEPRHALANRELTHQTLLSLASNHADSNRLIGSEFLEVPVASGSGFYKRSRVILTRSGQDICRFSCDAWLRKRGWCVRTSCPVAVTISIPSGRLPP